MGLAWNVVGLDGEEGLLKHDPPIEGEQGKRLKGLE